MLPILFLSLIVGFGTGTEVNLEVSHDFEDDVISIFSFKCTVDDYNDQNIVSISLLRQTSPRKPGRYVPPQLVAYIRGLTPSTPFPGPGFEQITLNGQIDFESDPETFLEVLLTNLRVEDLGLYTCEVVLTDEEGALSVSTAEARVAAQAGQTGLGIAEESTATSQVTIPAVEETTPEETTVPVEEITPEETTVPVEETTPEETTVPVEETTPEETIVPVEETTPEETTVAVEETTPEETTVPVEETTPEETTVAVEETTPEETTVPVEETTPEETTVPVEETTPEETTVPAEETTPEETTVPVEETTPEETTVPVEETTPEETTVPVEETTPGVTVVAVEETTLALEETSETPGLAMETLADIVEGLEDRLDSFNETVVEFERKLALLEDKKEETILGTTPEPVPTASGDIVSNYFVYENASYFFFKSDQIIDVKRAQTTCENRRLYLTEVNDAGELQAIADEVSPHIIEEGLVLVAGQKELDQNVWLYQGSQAQVDFFAWGPGESVQTTGSECLALRKSGDALNMVAVPCTSEQRNFYFLCEHDD